MTPATAAEKKKHTYADYLKTPDNERYELIGGDLLMTPSPSTRHQRVLMRLALILGKFVSDKAVGELFCAPFDVQFDDENVAQPDLLIVSKERSHIIGVKNIQGAPDITIEIVSESSAYRDIELKKKLYARFGVTEYWIVTPESESIEVYTLKGKAYSSTRVYNTGDVLESPLLKGLKLDLKRVF